jgi:hypothetical protein
MSDSTFQQAYNTVAATVGDEPFKRLQAKVRATLIYEEMRRIDLERAKTAPPPPPSTMVRRPGGAPTKKRSGEELTAA